MYDMYPPHFETADDAAPYSERGMSGLGHPEYFPVTVPARVSYAAEVAVSNSTESLPIQEQNNASR